LEDSKFLISDGAITVTTIIRTCSDCKYLRDTGEFTEGGAKPTCNHPVICQEKGHNCFDRIIPYETTDKTIPRRSGDQILQLHAPKEIPEWCPLKRFVSY
jgi:hypothetical protein